MADGSQLFSDLAVSLIEDDESIAIDENLLEAAIVKDSREDDAVLTATAQGDHLLSELAVSMK